MAEKLTEIKMEFQTIILWNINEKYIHWSYMFLHSKMKLPTISLLKFKKKKGENYEGL